MTSTTSHAALIFEDPRVQPRATRILWSILTATLWLVAVLMLLSPLHSVIGQLASDLISNFAWAQAWPTVLSVLMPTAEHHKMPIAMGTISLMLSSFTLPRALAAPGTALDRLGASHAAPGGELACPATFAPLQMEAIRDAQRMVAHHDAQGRLCAITLLPDHAGQAPSALQLLASAQPFLDEQSRLAEVQDC